MDDLTQKINLKSASSEQNDLLNYAIDKGIINLDNGIHKSGGYKLLWAIK